MDVIIPAKRNVIFDATMMNSLACARFFDLRQNHSFVQNTGKSNSLEAGSIVHKILEVYNKSIIGGMKRSDAIGFGIAAGQQYIAGCIHCTDFTPTQDAMRPSCGHEPNEYPGVQNTPLENQGYSIGWKWILETMNQYFDYYKNDFWIPLEAEVVKRKIIFEDDQIRVMWKAKLDSIMDTNQLILPMDHKTAKQQRDTLDLNNQFMGQCTVTDTRQVVINKIGFQTTKKPEEKFTRPILSYTPERLIEWQSEIVPYYAYKLIEYTEAGYWPADYTRCEQKFGNCVFIDVCRANPNMREEEININFKVGPKWDVGNEDE